MGQKVDFNRKFLIWPRAALLLEQGRQSYHNGLYSPVLAERLRCLARKVESGAYFAPFIFESSPRLEGGTCSAMALTFASRFMILRMSSVLTPTEVLLRRAMSTHRTSNTAFRHIQAVMNQVEVSPILLNEEMVQLTKIQALCSLFPLEVLGATPYYPFSGAIDYSCLKTLQTGLYFIRLIRLSHENRKRELHGHSVVLIKGPLDAYCYDPNLGVLKATPDHSNLHAMVVSIIKHADELFGFDGYRVYTLKYQDSCRTLTELDASLGIYPSLETVALNPCDEIAIPPVSETPIPVA